MMVVMYSGAYEVRFVLVIDRPGLRDASFRLVKPGTRTSQTWRYASQTAAVGMAREMLDGRWDFASEYIAAVEVVQLRGDHGRRTVRRRVERTCDETPRVRMAMLAVGGARRRAAIGADGYFYTRNIVELPLPAPKASQSPAEADDVEVAAAA